MIVSTEQINTPKPSSLFRLRVGFPISLLPMALLVMLYFCQVWVDIAGFTVRSEDVLISFFLGLITLRILATGKLRYRRHALNLPLLLWSGVLLFAVGITLGSPFDSVTKKDALINGIRLVLAFSTFYIIYNQSASTRSKVHLILMVIHGFSVITTVVSLLQIGYWDGWLPFSLPSILIEKASGSNMQPGREIFGLFIADTSAHAWAAMLALQSLTVFIVAQKSRHFIKKWLGFGYFGLLVIILLRMAVRNSFFGLFTAIGCVILLRSLHSRFAFISFVKKLLLVTGVALIVLGFLYLGPNTYYVRRARAAIPQLENGQLVISGASSIYGRLEYYSIAWQMFRDSPLIGHGFYSYQALSASYGRETVHAHNAYLQILAEMGLLGVLVFSWLLFFIIKKTWHLWRFKFTVFEMVVGQELLVGILIYFMFTALFGNTFGVPQQMSMLMLLLGSFGPLGFSDE